MVQVRIERLAAGGDGVGRMADGLVVFVPRTAPGDLAEIEVVQRKRRFARGRVLRLLELGLGRLEPPCRHYVEDRCGCCQLQHLSEEVQLAAKRSFVGEALRRIGKRRVEDPPITGSPLRWRYRTKITLAVKGGVIGLHRYDQPDEVFSLEDCLIAREPLMKLWSALKDRANLLPRGAASLTLREDRSEGLHLIVAGGEPPWDPGPLASALEGMRSSIWWQPARGAARVVSGAVTGYPALAFEQVNRSLASSIREEAIASLGEVRDRIVWDLYCGVGDSAGLLAQKGARVYGVEVDRQALEWARQHHRIWSNRITFIQGLVEENLPRLPEPDRVVVNPPRGGLHPRVTRWLQAWAQRRRDQGDGIRLCYVSCDPATLARDLARLPSLELLEVRAFDLFPQTSHVETLAVLGVP